MTDEHILRKKTLGDLQIQDIVIQQDDEGNLKNIQPRVKIGGYSEGRVHQRFEFSTLETTTTHTLENGKSKSKKN